MAKNRFLGPSQFPQQALSVQTPHSHTVDPGVGASQSLSMLLDDDEDSDICPVCDGVCTCRNSSSLSTDVPYSSHDSQISPGVNALPVVSTTSSSSSLPSVQAKNQNKLPSLKLKLNVPSKTAPSTPRSSSASLTGSAQPQASSSQSTLEDAQASPSAPLLDFYHPLLNPTGPKRRGRPPKAVVAARQAAERAAAQQAQEGGTFQGVDMSYSAYASGSGAVDSVKRKTTKSGGITKTRPVASNPRGRPAKNVKKKQQQQSMARPRKSVGTTSRRRGTNASSHYSADREDSLSLGGSRSDSDFDDLTSGRFPTFVSASGISDSDSDSDGSSSSSSSSSSSGFDTDSSLEAEEENYILREAHSKARVRRELLGDDATARRQHRKNWVIHPRKQSVGLSDVDMDGDSDATEDEEDEEHQPQQNEELDGDDEEEEDDTDGLGPRNGYVGLATGWSEDEDEESSFDAELFFANLAESEKGSSESGSSSDDGGEDGDQSDLDAMSVDEQDDQAILPAFEVTEAWDGRLVFTNGLHDGHDERRLVLHMEQHPVEPSPSPSQESALLDSVTEADEEGYEQDGELPDGDGDTTDEDLVGEDNLPNERGMQLFNFPPSINAINPLSTMSPLQSPTSRSRKPLSFRDSPRPADILAGNFTYESEEFDDEPDEPPVSLRSSSASHNGVPRRGNFAFDTTQERDHAIIGPQLRHAHVPSPHARAKIGRGRGSSSSSLGHQDELQRFLRNTLFPRPSSVPAQQRTPFLSPPIMEVTTPGAMSSTDNESDQAASAPIELDDMIDSSFLDTVEPHDSALSDGRQNGHLNRWDFISVGAFRQTRDQSTGWMSDNNNNNNGGGFTSDSADYGSMIKSSPLTTMMWQSKTSANNGSRPSVSTSPKKGDLSVLVSPDLLPIPDGERTPTPATRNKSMSLPGTPKGKKEARQDRKLKRKIQGSSPNNHRQQDKHHRPKHHHPKHQHHHHHSHHPNLKSRGSSGAQRSGSGVPPLSI